MKKKQHKYSVKELDALEQINLHAAGIDVGAEEIYVAVPKGRAAESVRAFASHTADLHRLAAWLLACGIETVAMESTGIYWIPLYEILEARGLAVYLVNARQTKNVTGRKSDVLDCQWIQQLHSYGLLQASFRPPEQICALRSVVRQREMLIHYRAAHIQHMQKALQLMNLQLTTVLSDITGTTGMAIIRAIVAGVHDPQELARLRHSQCAKSEAEIAQVLTGNYRMEHLFALQQALELYDFYGQQLQACDVQLEQMYHQMASPPLPSLPPPPGKRYRRKNQAFFDLRQALYRLTGVDLTEIDGIDALTAQTLVSEIGTDMSRWPTVKHFTAWLGLSPNNQVSGGKVLRRGSKKTQNRANTALRVAAQSVARSQSAIGAFYRRMRAKLGPAKAIVATAHKLARIVYFMLKHRQPYQDVGAEAYEQHQRERATRHLQRKAAKPGLRLVPIELTCPILLLSFLVAKARNP